MSQSRIIKISALCILFFVWWLSIYHLFHENHAWDVIDDSHLIHKREAFDVQSVGEDTRVVDAKITEWMQEILDTKGKEQEVSKYIAQQRKEYMCGAYKRACSRMMWKYEASAYEEYIQVMSFLFLVRWIDTYIQPDLLSAYIPPLNNIVQVTFIDDADKPRWQAGHVSIIINQGRISNSYEFLWVMLHEIAHTLDLGSIHGTYGHPLHDDFTEFGRKAFREDDTSLFLYKQNFVSEHGHRHGVDEEDFPTYYSQTNTFELKAESLTMCLLHNAVYQELMQWNTLLTNQFTYCSLIFDDAYIATNYATRDNLRTWLEAGKTPMIWDSTRLEKYIPNINTFSTQSVDQDEWRW